MSSISSIRRPVAAERRIPARREIVRVETPWGPLPVKLARHGGTR